MAGSTGLRGDVVDVNKKTIMIGASRWLVGAYDKRLVDEVTPVNPDSPPTGLVDIGLTRQDIALNLSAELFKYKTGIPATLKKLIVTGRDLSLSLTLEEWSPKNLSRALYDSAYPLKKYKATPAAAQAPNQPSGSTLNVGTVATFAIGDVVGLSNTLVGLLDTGAEYTITNITFSAPNYTLTFDRGVAETFSGPGPYIGVISAYKVPWATGRPCRMALYGINDDTSSGQRVLCIPRAIVTSGLNGSIPYNENAKLEMQVSADSFLDTDLDKETLMVILRFQNRGY